MPYELDPVLARGTGRTTRIVVNLIDAMLKNPGEEYEIIDHHGTREADLCLLKQVSRATESLGITLHIRQDSRGNRYFVHIEPLRKFL